jgi:hypothetical protein
MGLRHRPQVKILDFPNVVIVIGEVVAYLVALPFLA